MFPGLEVTFTAALSLALCNAMCPDVTDTSFISTTRDTLNDMSSSGNIPARSFLMQLDKMLQALNKVSTAKRPLFPLPLPLRMIHAGKILNDTLTDIIEINLAPTQVDLDLTQARTHVRHHTEENQQQSPVNPGEMAAMQSLASLTPISPIITTTAQPNALFVDCFDPHETRLDFDAANSAWLDFIDWRSITASDVFSPCERDAT